MQVPEMNYSMIKQNIDKRLEVSPSSVVKLPEGVLKIPKEGSEKLYVKLTEEGVKVRFQERSRGRMKFQVKFSADEAESFRNYCTAFKADETHVDDFIKFLLFTGMQAYNERVNEAVKAIASDKEAMKAAGLDVPPDSEKKEDATIGTEEV